MLADPDMLLALVKDEPGVIACLDERWRFLDLFSLYGLGVLFAVLDVLFAWHGGDIRRVVVYIVRSA